MARSKIKALPPAIKVELDRLLKEDRATIDQVVAHLKALGAEVSRSAVGRYHKRFEKIGQRMRESREVAQVWADRLGNEPQGDIGKLVMELLRTLAFDATLAMSEPGEDGAQVQLDPKAITSLALAMQRLEAASKWNLQREQQMRQAALQEAAQRVGEAAKAQGMDEDQARFWREKVLGVV